jgi:phosphatidylserine synthase
VRGAAFSHILVSVGVLSALFALLAVFDQSWELVFAWLGLGILAQIAAILLPPPLLTSPEQPPSVLSSHELSTRSLAVRNYASSLEVVSFLHNVFVPVVAMLHAGFLDGVAGVVVAGLILVSAQYRQANTDAGAQRDSFIGLPAAWGVVAFYFHAFDATPAAAFLAIGLGIILGLMPFAFPHPLQTLRWASMSRAISAIWLVTAAVVLWHGFPATVPAKAILLVAATYGIGLAVLLAQDPVSS